MFEKIKKLFKKEEETVIEMSEEDEKKMKEYYDIAKEAHEKGEVTEWRDATGKLLGFNGPDGFEKVDDQYELREMLYKVLKRLDKIKSALDIEKADEEMKEKEETSYDYLEKNNKHERWSAEKIKEVMKGKHLGLKNSNGQVYFDSRDMTDIVSNDAYDKGFQEEIKKRCNELIEEIKKKYPEAGIDLKQVGYLANLEEGYGILSFIDIMDLEALLIDLDANIEEYKKEDNMEMLNLIYSYPHSSSGSTARKLKYKVKR